MGNQQQNKESTQVSILRNGKVSIVSVNDFLAQMEYETSYGEPIWFKSQYYGQPKMFVGDMNGKPVFVGPYLAGDGIEIDNNIDNKGLGKIKMEYPIPVIVGNSGKVLAVNETETGIEWIELGIEHGTYEYWNSQTGYIPKPGTIIIYDDYYTDPSGLMYPGIKIGSGNAYVQDLVFVGQREAEILDAHIHNTDMHITQEERERWNNKLNIDDAHGVVDETLIFTRN